MELLDFLNTTHRRRVGRLGDDPALEFAVRVTSSDEGHARGEAELRTMNDETLWLPVTRAIGPQDIDDIEPCGVPWPVWPAD